MFRNDALKTVWLWLVGCVVVFCVFFCLFACLFVRKNPYRAKWVVQTSSSCPS